jgi:uncharacterized protein
VIFVDSNIPMYIIGAEHPNKWKARQSLEELIGRKQRLVTDAEVYQEILHRYSAIHRNDAIPPAFTLLDQIIDEVYSIRMIDVRTAKDIMLKNAGLSARDAVHIAVMKRCGIRRILSFDSGFDQLEEISRLK